MTIKQIANQIVINPDVEPKRIQGYEVRCHLFGKKFVWNPSAMKLHLDKGQERPYIMSGKKLRWNLLEQLSISILNANVLDFLLLHPKLIPKEWKSPPLEFIQKHPCFWGTLYTDNDRSDDRLFVRYLRWGVAGYGGWRWLCGVKAIDDGFDASFPAAFYGGNEL